jgi:hypothetical protein
VRGLGEAALDVSVDETGSFRVVRPEELVQVSSHVLGGGHALEIRQNLKAPIIRPRLQYQRWQSTCEVIVGWSVAAKSAVIERREKEGPNPVSATRRSTKVESLDIVRAKVV